MAKHSQRRSEASPPAPLIDVKIQNFKLRIEAAIAMNNSVVTFLKALPNSVPMAGEAENARVALIGAAEHVNELMVEDLQQFIVSAAYAADGDPTAAADDDSAATGNDESGEGHA